MSALIDAACATARRTGVSPRCVRLIWGIGVTHQYRPTSGEWPGRYGMGRVGRRHSPKADRRPHAYDDDLLA